MTRRERLHRAYFHQEMDRPAVYSREGFPDNDPSYDKLKKYLHENSELKSHWAVRELCSYSADSFYESYDDDFRRKVTIIHTPSGDLQSTYLESLNGQPGLQETFPLKDAADIEKYLMLPPPAIFNNVHSFFEADSAIGDNGLAVVALGMNPAGTVVELFGSENFAMMSITDRDLIHSLCEERMEVILDRLKFIADNKIGPYFEMFGEEYLVPPLHSPKDFYDFNVKYDKPIIDFIHDIGGRIHIHSHGSIKHVIQGFVEMGTDVLHPFEAPPNGDITPQEAKLYARGKMCLEGNIQIAHMFEHSPEQIMAETAALIDVIFDDHRGLIVSPTASPYIFGEGEKCFNNYKAMIDTVLGRNK